MEKVIYASFAAERDEQFQLCTRIIERDAKRYVRKSALNQAGKVHIAQLAENRKTILKRYCECGLFGINAITAQGDGWTEFEYLTGETLEKWFYEKIQTGDISAVKEMLEKFWQSLLRFSEGPFQTSGAFREVFGEELPEGCCLHGATDQDIDLVFSNLFLTGDQPDNLTITDYEWVFPFSVPLEYVYYRSVFCSVALSKASEEDLEAFYAIAGIRKDELPSYLKMEIAFQRYVTGQIQPIAEHYRRFAKESKTLKELEDQLNAYKDQLNAYKIEWGILTREKKIRHCEPVALIRGKQEIRKKKQEESGAGPDATIVIPTKNGGDLFRQVLDRVYGQVTKYTYEVICVDSGSTDNTLQIIQESSAKLLQIKPEEFGHGKTRNFGASHGTGEFICFLTQDALPVHESWLENMLNAMKLDPQIAGGFGRHLPYPGCNFIDERDINGLFDGFGHSDTIYYNEDPDKYENDPGYRSVLAFFSDNNSCLRRSVWEQYPYPEVEFAEDQIWMRQMIEKGFRKVYCPEAAVYHSHNYDPSTYFMRYYDEHKGLYDIHGYTNLKHWWYIPAATCKHVLNDIRLIRTTSSPMRGKLGMIKYSLRRNYARYAGGYIGGHYHEKSPEKQAKLDRKYSQQYRQRRGING